MPNIVAEKYKFVAGVDTHAKTHHLSLVNNMGALLGRREIKVLPCQMEKAIDWVVKKTEGNVLFAVEGTSSYGETFTMALTNRGLPVCEVKAPKTKTRGQTGKTDEVDSLLAARSVLIKPIDKLIAPKSQGMIKVLRILLSSRRNIITQFVMDKNALIALLRTNNLTTGYFSQLKTSDIKIIADWSVEPDLSIKTETAIAKLEAKRLASMLCMRQKSLVDNANKLHKVIKALAPSLLDMPGMGPVTSAQILCSYSHKGRFRNADAFACLAGTTPLPASSGNVTRHRLSRFGDRLLNSALTTIVMTRMRCDEQTKEYMKIRTTMGKSHREIKRSLKHYLARSIFKDLEKLDLERDFSIAVS